jgi:hypothetical protein
MPAPPADDQRRRRINTMTSMTTLAELHVRQFVSRQKRQDEITRDSLQHAEQARRRRKPRETWREQAFASAGPLGLLDAVGQAEESWIEMLEHAPRCDMKDRPADKRREYRHIPQLMPRTA